MTKSELKFDQVILEKRSTDADQPATGKFALFNKSGSMFMRDGDSGSIQELGATPNNMGMTRLHTDPLQNTLQNDSVQWDIPLPSGFKILRFLFEVETNDTVGAANFYARFDDDATLNTYTHNLGTNTWDTGILAGYVYGFNANPRYSRIWLDVMNYDDSSRWTLTDFKTIQHQGNIEQYKGFGHRNIAESNTELNVFLNIYQLKAGSSYTLWGLK